MHLIGWFIWNYKVLVINQQNYLKQNYIFCVNVSAQEKTYQMLYANIIGSKKLLLHT
jgi:hypothetical protein